MPPCWPYYLRRQQVLVLCDGKVAFMWDERDVREQDPSARRRKVGRSHSLAAEQPQPDWQQRYFVQKAGSRRKRGIGLTNSRLLVQTRCMSICSVTKSSGRGGAGGAADAVAWGDRQPTASSKSCEASASRVLSRCRRLHTDLRHAGRSD